MAILLRKVSASLIHLISDESSAFAMWQKLERQFNIMNAYALVGWMDEIFDCQFKPGDDFSKHLVS